MKAKFLLILLGLSVPCLIISQTFEKQGAGVTILVHGWNPDGNQPDWMGKMADAMITRNGGNVQAGTITVTGTAGNLTATCSNWNFDLANQTSGEIVVLLNWTAVSNHLNTGITAQSVAAAVSPKIYLSQSGQPALSELPIHLVGHSRGGGIIFEIARLLGLQGIEVEQVTALDPHPLTSVDPQGLNAPFGPGQTIDTPVKIYENILFTDNYYQTIEYPKGQYLAGAYNRRWTSMPGGYHNETGFTYNFLGTTYKFSDHLNVILMYHGTIDLNTPTTNGEATLTQTERNAWFNSYENAGENTGYTYSRMARGDRKSNDTPVSDGDKIIDGYHSNILLGGSGSREKIDWTHAVWPNVIIADVIRNDTLLAVGRQTIFNDENLQLSLSYHSSTHPSTITFYIDTDRNPYNNNHCAVVAAQNLNATGPDIMKSAYEWIVSGLSTATKYYLFTMISDGSHTRYHYLDYEFEINALEGIEKDRTDEISIFPNPAKNNIYIQTSSNPVTVIQFYDCNGTLLAEQSIIKNSGIIDIRSFNAGIYIVRIQTGKSIFVRKIIKE